MLTRRREQLPARRSVSCAGECLLGGVGGAQVLLLEGASNERSPEDLSERCCFPAKSIS